MTNTKTIAEIEVELKEAKQREKDRDKTARAEQSRKWKELVRVKENWEWLVKTESREARFGEGKRNGVYVCKRVKPEILTEWRKFGFPTLSSDFQRPDSWFGMFYYRTDENILTCIHAGHGILNEPMLCNDEEWAAILAGNIPEKYVRKCG